MTQVSPQFKIIAERYFAQHSKTREAFDPASRSRELSLLADYVDDLMTYHNMAGLETINLDDLFPCLHDKTATTDFDPQYFYQGNWAFRRIMQSGVEEHVDVGSQVDLVGYLAAVTRVVFIDIRPLAARLDNLECRYGSILELPFEDRSVPSISSLHVAEHIGLGRYGDPLDPQGTQKAIAELARVLAPGGSLYFSLPIGRPRVAFNAHRVHSPQQILEYFSDLHLVELSGVDDSGTFVPDIDVDALARCNYGCGLFRFTR